MPINISIKQNNIKTNKMGVCIIIKLNSITRFPRGFETNALYKIDCIKKID